MEALNLVEMTDMDLLTLYAERDVTRLAHSLPASAEAWAPQAEIGSVLSNRGYFLTSCRPYANSQVATWFELSRAGIDGCIRYEV